MNYKVTFYKDEMEMLTERKGNFVNKLKKISSNILDMLGKEIERQYGFKGTTAQKIIQFMLKNAMSKNNDTVTIKLFTDEVMRYPDQKRGEAVPIMFNFNCRGSHLDRFHIDCRGAVSNSMWAGYRSIERVKVDVFYYINETTANDDTTIKATLNEIQSTLVHEIAHAFDENLVREISNYKEGAKTSHEDLKYLNYWLKPTEIRSHMNEVLQMINSKRHQNPRRTFKNMYKNADKAASREEYPTPFTDKQKDLYRRAFSKLDNANKKQGDSHKGIDALYDVLCRAFRNQIPQNMKKFVAQYHVAFVRDSSPKMKERYYDKLFTSQNPPSLDTMNDFFEEIKTVYRSLTRVSNALKKKYDNRYSYSEVYSQKSREFDKFEDEMWDDERMKPVFQSFDPKSLKKTSKIIIDEFKKTHEIDKDSMPPKRTARQKYNYSMW